MSFYYNQLNEYNGEVKWGNVLLTALCFLVVSMAVMPVYSVWSRELRGKAELKEAEWNRQIAVEEARAKRESATLEAEAEVERAKGVAKANEIIADGLGGAEGYLRYLYINTLNDLDTQLIYVPTEAGLPILEANRNK